MIIFSLYPNSLVGSKSDLSQAVGFAKKFLPKGTGVHILPFGENTGDFGYFQTDWASVDTSIATEASLREACKYFTVFADGIYNHVSVQHPVAQAFFQKPPEHAQNFYARQQSTRPDAPLSPKGGSTQQCFWGPDGKKWWYWQTFPTGSIDVNLNSHEIICEVVRHHSFLRKLDVAGLRLDAPAYFGKDYRTNGMRENNSESVKLVRRIASLSQKSFRYIIAQLDIGDVSDLYFDNESFQEVIPLDYAFSAYMLHALANGSARALVRHLNSPMSGRSNALRPLRTHDGVYLRSENLDPETKSELLALSRRSRLNLRVVDDVPYEINDSLPHSLRLLDPDAQVYDLLELSLVATLMAPGHPCVFFPAAIGWEPECNAKESDDDPRALNRVPISKAFAKHIEGSHFHRKLRRVFSIFAELRLEDARIEEVCWEEKSDAIDNRFVRVEGPRFWGLLNFSKDSPAKGIEVGDYPPSLSKGLSDGQLNPRGYAVWAKY